RYGVRARLAVLERFAIAERVKPMLRDCDNRTPGESASLAFFPKHLLASMFAHYERVFPAFLALPPHGLVGIDIHGVRDNRSIETYLLEATLFEDMATLFNATLEEWDELESQPQPSKPGLKRLEALMRATAKAAFNLLEGYVNGIGYDIVL